MTSALTNPELSLAATMALKDISRDCTDSMKPYAEQVSSLVPARDLEKNISSIQNICSGDLEHPAVAEQRVPGAGGVRAADVPAGQDALPPLPARDPSQVKILENFGSVLVLRIKLDARFSIFLSQPAHY